MDEHNKNQSEPTPVHIAPPQDERLIEVLTSLESQIQKQTSLKFTLSRGAVYGLGTVLGATLLLALFGGLIATILGVFGDIPGIGKYIDDQALEQYQEQ